MKNFHRELGRRQFISVSTMVIGAGMLAKPCRMLFAAEDTLQSEKDVKADVSKYGKYIFSGYKEDLQEAGRGTFVAYLGKTVMPGAPLCRFVRMPPPGPMPEHGGTETHDIPSFLIHLGNDPDDPMDLGAEAQLYLGTGEDREKHILTKSTAVYLPPGVWHAPWQVKKITKPITFIDIMAGEGEKSATDPSKEIQQGGGGPGAPQGMPQGGRQGMPEGSEQGGPPGGLTKEELGKAKTSGYNYDKYLLSGVEKGRTDPTGGKLIAYLDCTMFPEAPMTRIIRFQPKDAPFRKTEFSKHKYGTLLVHLGTDYEDPFDLGAEVELYMGEEKEKHAFNLSTLVYIPAGMAFGPWQIKNIRKPFNFLQVVLGPETPVAI